MPRRPRKRPPMPTQRWFTEKKRLASFVNGQRAILTRYARGMLASIRNNRASLGLRPAAGLSAGIVRMERVADNLLADIDRTRTNNWQKLQRALRPRAQRLAIAVGNILVHLNAAMSHARSMPATKKAAPAA